MHATCLSSLRSKTLISHGMVHDLSTHFDDSALFKSAPQFSILKKLKIWFGSAALSAEKKQKFVLGIQAAYKDSVTGSSVESAPHSCEIKSTEIEVKELDLESGDYFCKFEMGFNEETGGVFYVRFVAKSGREISFGERGEGGKTVNINNGEEYMIQSLFGTISSYGLGSLGMRYVVRREFLMWNLGGIFRLRHELRGELGKNEEWIDNVDKVARESDRMMCVVRVCLMEDEKFVGVMKFLV